MQKLDKMLIINLIALYILGDIELGFTSLRTAVSDDRMEIAKLLIECKANVNFGGSEHPKENWVPLASAAAKGSMRFVELLIENGANINAHTISHMCPLAYAIHSASYIDGGGDVVKHLLGLGAKLHDVDEYKHLVEQYEIMQDEGTLFGKVDKIAINEHSVEINGKEIMSIAGKNSVFMNGDAKLLRTMDYLKKICPSILRDTPECYDSIEAFAIHILMTMMETHSVTCINCYKLLY